METLKTMKKTLVACISVISIYGCQTAKQPQTQSNLAQPAASPSMMTLGTSQVKTNDFKRNTLNASKKFIKIIA